MGTLLIAFALFAQLQAAQQASPPSARVQFFPVQTLITKGQSFTEQRRGPSTQVLCTMPMLRPKADIDSRIVVEPSKTDAKIRSIDAGKCIER